MRRSGSTRKTSALKRGRASGRRTFKFPDAAPRPSHVCRSGHVVRVALQSVDQKMGQSRLAHFFSPFSGTLTVEMLGILNKFERAIVHSLLIMLMLAVLSSTVELAVLLVEQFMKPPRLFLLDMSELLPIFSFFLMVLIGVELIEVVKVYLSEDTLHVEVVFLVAMIAVARKVIVLDYEVTSPGMLYGIAAIIVALCGGFCVLKKALRGDATPRES